MTQREELLPIKEIEKFPTDRDNVHESVFQAAQILKHVEIMLIRKDSKATILGFINHFQVSPQFTTNTYP